MNVQRCLAMGAILIVGIGLGGVFSWQPSFAQQKMEQRTGGRYELATVGNDPTNFAIIVIDTATGQCCKQIGQPNNAWLDLGSPPVRGRK